MINDNGAIAPLGPLAGSTRPQRSEDGGDPRSGPLGITTISTDTFGPFCGHDERHISVIDQQTGEINLFQPNSKTRDLQPVWDKDENLLERWLLQKTARRILSKPGFMEPRWKRFAWRDHLLTLGAMPEEVSHEPVYTRSQDHSTHQVMAPLFRVVQCHQSRLPGKFKKAELWQSALTGNVKFHNLAVCGSVWTCPICSPKIGATRRDEISKAYEAVLGQGGTAYLVTFTVKHGVGDDAVELVAKLKESGQFLMKSRTWKNITRKSPPKRPKADSPPFFNWLGRVAALEVTHGLNGWHPHEHHLFFFHKKLTTLQVNYLKDRLALEWQKSCVNAGLPPPSLDVGIDVRIALSAADYLTKFGCERGWSIERELVSADKKKGKKQSRTPFQILRDAAHGDERSEKLFSTFAVAFKGRSQLEYSRSLLAWLKLNASLHVDTSEEADQAISSSLEAESLLLGELTDYDFGRIVKNHLHGLVLIYCRNHGFDATVSFIRSFKPCLKP